MFVISILIMAEVIFRFAFNCGSTESIECKLQ